MSCCQKTFLSQIHSVTAEICHIFCRKANIIVDLTQIVTNLSWRKLGQLQFPGLSIRLIDTFVRIKSYQCQKDVLRRVGVVQFCHALLYQSEQKKFILALLYRLVYLDFLQLFLILSNEGELVPKFCRFFIVYREKWLKISRLSREIKKREKWELQS